MRRGVWVVYIPQRTFWNRGVAPTMQRRVSFCDRTRKIFKATEKRGGLESWQEDPWFTRFRSHIYSARPYRKVRSGSELFDTMARCDQGVGEGADIYFISTAAWGEDSDSQAEDEDLDDSQSQGWRGG